MSWDVFGRELKYSFSGGLLNKPCWGGCAQHSFKCEAGDETKNFIEKTNYLPLHWDLYDSSDFQAVLSLTVAESRQRGRMIPLLAGETPSKFCGLIVKDGDFISATFFHPRQYHERLNKFFELQFVHNVFDYIFSFQFAGFQPSRREGIPLSDVTLDEFESGCPMLCESRETASIMIYRKTEAS